ncbi:MAG TPA: TIGR03809 family protein [Afipia sp.]
MSNVDHKTGDHKRASNAGRSVVARWRLLAQQRLDHLIELYQSGRWKLYYKEQDFLAMVQEARAALKVWEQLAPPDSAFDKPVEVTMAQEGLANETAPRMAGALLNGIAAEHDPRKS